MGFETLHGEVSMYIFSLWTPFVYTNFAVYQFAVTPFVYTNFAV